MEEIKNYFEILQVVASIKNILNDNTFSGIVITKRERDKLIN